MFAVRGIAAVILGILAFPVPNLTLEVLVQLFGAYAVVHGLTLLIGFARYGTFPHAPPMGAGADWRARHRRRHSRLRLARPDRSVVDCRCNHSPTRDRGEIWQGLGGVPAILFGIYLALVTGAGLLTLVWLVGFWAIFFGISSLMLAWRLRGLQGKVTSALAQRSSARGGLAEREGFEPPDLSVNGFQDRRHKPLGHLSVVAGALWHGSVGRVNGTNGPSLRRQVRGV